MSILHEVNYFIDGFLKGQSVPIYFFISGFVFFLGIEFDKKTYYRKLKNRFKTLFIPYIVWNTFAILLRLVLLTPLFSGLLSNTNEPDFSFSSIVSSFWDSNHGIFPPLTAPTANTAPVPENAPLWFLRDLMIVVLCTPLLSWIIKHTRYYFILSLGILWFVLSYFTIGHINSLIIAFFYFSFGAYMSINGKDMLIEFGRFFKPSMIMYPLLAVLYIVSAHILPEASHTIKQINIFVGLIFAYNLASWLLKNDKCKVNSFLASSSFFIYISHALVFNRIHKALFILFDPRNEIEVLSIYIGTILITIFILLASYYLLRRYTPGILKFLTGKK